MTSTRRYTVDAVLSLAEAADYLGVSERHVRNHCQLPDGDPERLPSFRLGKVIRVPYWGLLQWIAKSAGCPPPPELPESLRKISY